VLTNFPLYIHESRFLERITALEAECHGVFGSLQNLVLTVPVGHEQAGK
jgi:hypothetical protein